MAMKKIVIRTADVPAFLSVFSYIKLRTNIEQLFRRLPQPVNRVHGVDGTDRINLVLGSVLGLIMMQSNRPGSAMNTTVNVIPLKWFNWAWCQLLYNNWKTLAQ